VKNGEWNEVNWSEVKWRDLVERVYYRGLTVMQFACGLLYSMSCRCLIVSLLFALCLLLFVVLINCSILLIIRFMFVLLFCMFCFIFCVFCVYVLHFPMYTVVYFLFVYNFTDHCHPLVVKKNHIIIILSKIRSNMT
jgi:hypothetical protein